MEPNEITNYIIKELGRHRVSKDIALALCEKTGMSWGEAQKLIRQVQSSHAQEIAARQSPLLIGLSVASSILGLVSLCAGIWVVSQGVVGRGPAVLLGMGIILSVGGIRGSWDLLRTFLKTK